MSRMPSGCLDLRAIGRAIMNSTALFMALHAPVMGETVPITEVKVSSITATSLMKAPCLRLVANPAAVDVQVKPEPAGLVLVYTPRDTDPKQFNIDVKAGQPGADANAECTNATTTRLALTRDLQSVPDKALGEAFNILVAAFVLALLMESAFALLFNWRVFQEFFVGRSWRSIIMFFVSLVVVRQFDLDLLAELFDAYNGETTGDVKRSWLTSVLTAMILAGGSVGVNRILVALGFRSQLPKAELERESLVVRNQAYVSVTVRTANLADQFHVNAEPVPPGAAIVLLGVISRRDQTIRARLLRLFVANRNRYPTYGGHTLDSTQCYRISVTNVRTGDTFDMSGKKIVAPAVPTEYRFQPGAIVDFDLAV
jgi:hypothetical protein